MDILKNLGIDPALLVTQIIGFAILYWLANRFAFKPIFGILAERQADIKLTYDQLDADRATMERTRQEYEERLAGIEAQAREKIQQAIKEAQDLRAGIVSDAKKQGEVLLEKARAEADRERERAFLEMRGEIVNLSILPPGKCSTSNSTRPGIANWSKTS